MKNKIMPWLGFLIFSGVAVLSYINHNMLTLLIGGLMGGYFFGKIETAFKPRKRNPRLKSY